MLDSVCTLEVASSLLGATPRELPRRIHALQADLQAVRRQASDLRRELAVSDFENKLGHLTQVDRIPVLSAAIRHANTETLRELADRFRDRNKSGVVALGAIVDDKPQLIVAVTDDLTQRGIHAGKIIGEVARMVGGGGGGRPNMAQAGGKDPSRLDEALGRVPELIRQALNQA